MPLRAGAENGRRGHPERHVPPAGLRIDAGPLTLRGIDDALLAEVCALALDGIHPSDEMPFYVPWTQVGPTDLVRNTAAFHWRARAEFSPEVWDLELAVLWQGRVVGVQGLRSEGFLVTRSGESGSWLGRRFQGAGIGTAMRRALCAFAFDHLGFSEVRSGAFVDNPASLAVSRKVGYREDGRRPLDRAGERAVNVSLVLTPETFVRGPEEITVEGLGPVRRALGLGA